MGKSRAKKNNGLSDNELRRIIKILILPLTVILIAAVIFISNIFSGKRGGESDSSGVSQSPVQNTAQTSETQVISVPVEAENAGTESGAVGSAGTETVGEENAQSHVAPDNQKYIQNFEQYELQKDQIPEVIQLIETYCKAKTECDPKALAGVFGRELTPEEQEIERARMEKTAMVVEGYENVACYTMPGLSEDSYVAYPYYEIKFKDAQTPLPVLTMCYIEKDSNGNYVMSLDFDDEVESYIAMVNVSEDVRLLAQQVDQKAAAAVAGDSMLNSIYHGIASGAPAGGEGETGESGEEESTTDVWHKGNGEETTSAPPLEPDIQIETTTAAS